MRDVKNENSVAQAFTNQSEIFDELYDTNYLVTYARKIIRAELLRLASPGCRILELNAGTGTDALFLASKGFSVLATDISSKMVAAARAKVSAAGYDDRIIVEQCNFWDIGDRYHEKFDFVYSNFGGLNCTENLDQLLVKVLNQLSPGGKALLVIMPVFCPWERVQLLLGNTRVGLRRRRGRAANAHIEGQHFKVWYYNPSYIKKVLKDNAILRRVQSLSLFVPPSSHRNFDKQYPRLLRFLEWLEKQTSHRWPFRNWGDYTILSLEKL